MHKPHWPRQSRHLGQGQGIPVYAVTQDRLLKAYLCAWNHPVFQIFKKECTKQLPSIPDQKNAPEFSYQTIKSKVLVMHLQKKSWLCICKIFFLVMCLQLKKLSGFSADFPLNTFTFNSDSVTRSKTKCQ